MTEFLLILLGAGVICMLLWLLGYLMAQGVEQ
jgi:hypothetical protein